MTNYELRDSIHRLVASILEKVEGKDSLPFVSGGILAIAIEEKIASFMMGQFEKHLDKDSELNKFIRIKSNDIIDKLTNHHIDKDYIDKKILDSIRYQTIDDVAKSGGFSSFIEKKSKELEYDFCKKYFKYEIKVNELMERVKILEKELFNRNEK